MGHDQSINIDPEVPGVSLVERDDEVMDDANRRLNALLGCSNTDGQHFSRYVEMRRS